jgi:hypothetical protein
MESSPIAPSGRKESLAVLDAYITSHGLASSPPKAFRRSLVVFRRHDLAVPRQHGPILALKLRSATMKPNDKWSYTTHTYLDPRLLVEAVRCAKLPGAMYEPLIAYVVKTRRPTGPGLFEWKGCFYNVLGLRSEDFLGHMKARAATSSWENKCDISAALFESLARPLSHWLKDSTSEIMA